jgi:hypothetical protein
VIQAGGSRWKDVVGVEQGSDGSLGKKGGYRYEL